MDAWIIAIAVIVAAVAIIVAMADTRKELREIRHALYKIGETDRVL